MWCCSATPTAITSGNTKAAGPDAGTCDQPGTVSAAPNSTTAEIAAAKNSAVVVSNDMPAWIHEYEPALKDLL